MFQSYFLPMILPIANILKLNHHLKVVLMIKSLTLSFMESRSAHQKLQNLLVWNKIYKTSYVHSTKLNFLLTILAKISSVSEIKTRCSMSPTYPCQFLRSADALLALSKASSFKISVQVWHQKKDQKLPT